MERFLIHPDFDSITLWFNKIGFSSNGVTQQQTDRIIHFVFPQEAAIDKRFLSNPTILKTAALAFELYRAESRKVSGDPYFKHALKTACLCAQLVRAEDFKQGDSNEYYWEIMEATAFLHDVIEIRRDKDNYNVDQLTDDLIEAGVEEGQAKRIAYLTDKLTPPPKKEKTPFNERRREKQEDFLRIMTDTCNDWEGRDKEMMAKILGLVKVNDALAVLEETVADLPLGRTNGLFAGKPLGYVIGVFSDRIEYLKTHRDSIPDAVVDKLRSCFNQLNQLLTSE